MWFLPQKNETKFYLFKMYSAKLLKIVHIIKHYKILLLTHKYEFSIQLLYSFFSSFIEIYIYFLNFRYTNRRYYIHIYYKIITTMRLAKKSPSPQIITIYVCV